MITCSQCQTQFSGKFCPACGTPSEQPVAAAAMPTPPQPPRPGMPPVPPSPQAGYPAPPTMPLQPGIHPAYPQPGMTMPPQPQKSGGVLKWVLIGVGGLVGLFVLLMVLGAVFGDDTPSAGPGQQQTAVGSVGVPVITTKINEDTMEPQGQNLTTIAKTEPIIYAATEINLKNGQLLHAKWYIDGQLAIQTDLPLEEDIDGWAAFNITQNGQGFPLGTYKVEIYLDGQLKRTGQFTVK